MLNRTAGYTDRFSQQRCHVRRGISHDAGRNTKVAHGAVFFHPRSSRVTLIGSRYMCSLSIFLKRARCCQNAAASIQSYRYDPAPYIKEPAIRFRSQAFDLFTDLIARSMEPLIRRLPALPFITPQRFQWTPRYRSAEKWWCAHVGFVKGFFVYVTFNVDHGS